MLPQFSSSFNQTLHRMHSGKIQTIAFCLYLPKLNVFGILNISYLSYIASIPKVYWFHLAKGQAERQDPWASCCLVSYSIDPSFQKEVRTVRQMHYMTWPDKKRPLQTYALLDFLRKVTSGRSDDGHPIIVHCRYIPVVYLFIIKMCTMRRLLYWLIRVLWSWQCAFNTCVSHSLGTESVWRY